MRRKLWFWAALVVVPNVNPVIAGSLTQQDQSARSAQSSPTYAGFETYRGYSFDLSESSDRKDAAATADMVRRQLDVVENSGLSPRVLQLFRGVPVIESEMACLDENAAAACYGHSLPERDYHALRSPTIWDNQTHKWTNPDPVQLAADTGLGVIMLRPNMIRYEMDPVLLHEFLHAYHAKLMPNGFENKGINDFYAAVQNKGLFTKDAYLVKNSREFFAVTASIFLSGKDSVHEPYTRSKLKEQMPDYFKYLVGVFGFDPDASSVTPVAFAN